MGRRIDGTNGADVIIQGTEVEIQVFALGGNDRVELNRTDDLGGGNFVDAGTGDDLVINLKEGGNEILLGDGNDTYVGTGFNLGFSDFDVVRGGAGDDLIAVTTLQSAYFGDEGNDTFVSEGQRNAFDGGTGSDTISYELRDDSTVLAGRGVTIDLTEQKAATGASTFEIFTSIENATGTNVRDLINGDAGANILKGRGGDDLLLGLGGNDTLDGGAGADDMRGGAGNDVYFVDNVGDRVTELAGQGVDKVNTTVSFDARGSHIENIAIIGSGRANVVGNELDNVIAGNNQANAINGGLGADRMAGGLGNDVYTVDNIGDVVIEAANAGTDTVKAGISFTLGANVENLTLVTNRQINAIGNALDNVIVGNARPNVIIGMGGRDLMTGGAGADRFDFRAVSDSPFAAFDRITDLSDEDVINLSTIDARTDVAGDQAFTLVSAFSGQSGQMTLTFNASAGFTVLAADVNGDGVGDFRIVLDGDHQDYDNFRL